jgi:hypothetical protein
MKEQEDLENYYSAIRLKNSVKGVGAASNASGVGGASKKE